MTEDTVDDAYKQWDKVVIPTSNISALVRLDKDTYNILPRQQYKIRVTATNDQSEGPPSNTVTIATGSGGCFFFITFLFTFVGFTDTVTF